MRIWDEYLPSSDREVFAASGAGSSRGMGTRPVLLVVDVTYAFTGDVDEPILDSIAKWPDSCGPSAWQAIPRIQELLVGFRERALPVFYSMAAPPRADGFGGLPWRSSRRSSVEPVGGVDGSAIVADIAPTSSDVVIAKVAPSAFFGTHLTSYLTALGADTVVVCGATTSGCVRATVVDAFSHSLRVVLAEDATFDRGQVSHAIGLFDMDAKYADVMLSAEVLRNLGPMVEDPFAGRWPGARRGPGR
jgi:maleamate amidohydrolase